MCAADALNTYDARQLAKLIKRTRLSTRDRKIATMCLIDKMRYADIGAAVGYSRGAIGYRLNHIILPALEATARK